MKTLHLTIGLLANLLLGEPRRRDERGLSQSTENAILLAGAVAIATTVMGLITVYVTNRIPR